MNEDALRALIRDAIARAGARSASTESILGDAPQLLHLAQHHLQRPLAVVVVVDNRP